jgi:hypothetical protein
MKLSFCIMELLDLDLLLILRKRVDSGSQDGLHTD